jgi:hypothetical protein
MAEDNGSDFVLKLQGAAISELPDHKYAVILQTSRGRIQCFFHPSPRISGAVIWVGGALGGVMGPAGGLYADLAEALVGHGITSLRLDYRQPGVFPECVLDVLAGASFLKGLGATGVALVGHSFGGAVVIKAGELSPEVRAVAALSSQTYGAQDVARLAPRALLLVHGTDDTHLPPTASQWIYDRALEPKELVFYEGAGHRLHECREKLFALLQGWLVERVGK